MERIDCKNFNDLFEQIEKIKLKLGDGRKFLFRGHAASDFELKTTLERFNDKIHKKILTLPEYYRVVSKYKPEIEMHTGKDWGLPSEDFSFRDFQSIRNMLSRGEVPELPLLTYLRHHGFASPLLDWSYSPYVAAHFAFREHHKSSHCAIYMLSISPMLEKNSHTIGIWPLNPASIPSRRHIIQQSCYTISLRFDRAEWEFVQHDLLEPIYQLDDTIAWKFIIPSAERVRFLAKLGEMNINPFTLMMSDDGLMEDFNLREVIKRTKPPQ